MGIPIYQRTIAHAVVCSGKGVHSGKPASLTIKPAPANHGIKFKRIDLPEKPVIPAHFNMVIDTSLATVIGYNGFIVSTIEHLMATFAGLGIDNALVELDSYEVPIMDGSASEFTALIRSAGIEDQNRTKYYFVVKKPILLSENGKFVAAYPAPSFQISYSIEFNHPLIHKQARSIHVTDQSFEKEISKARTFGFLNEVEYMKKFGLARGGSLDNAVVIGPESIMNRDGLRYEDEFVRHKILDSIGDFSLLGLPILGHIDIHKSGHAFNHAFLKEFFSQKQSWETRAGNELNPEA